MLVIDNFLEKNILAYLNNKPLWDKLDSVETTMYDPQKYVFGVREHNVWEDLADIVYEQVFCRETPNEQYSNNLSLEYWCNILNPGNELDWHQDKDEKRYEKNPLDIVCPKAGAVIYAYPHTVNGGYLEIEHMSTHSIEVERIEPVYNRLVLFDVSKEHRVSKIWSGDRYGFQVNLW